MGRRPYHAAMHRGHAGPGLGLVLVAVIVGACGGAAAPSAAPAATPAAPTAAPATVGASSGAGSASQGSNGHDAPDLEALLPTQFQSTTLERDSLVGANALSSDSSSSVITKFLSDHGRTLPDFAVAQASDPAGQLDIEIVAFRVRGADPTALQTAILEATKAADPELAISQVTVAGHQITRGDSGGRIRYLYSSSGVVFGVSSGSQALVDAAVAALP